MTSTRARSTAPADPVGRPEIAVIDPSSLGRDTVRAALCTHNRSDAAVTAATTLFAAAPGARLVIVDSASTPDHAAALVAFAARDPRVELVRLDQPGIALARNTAMTAARSEWVAFFDDDVLVDDGWWNAATALTASAPAHVAVIGGPILPLWPAERPVQVGWRWLMFLSCIEEVRTDVAVPGSKIGESYNGNLLLRTRAWQEAGGYPEALGRVGDVLLSGEENELQLRILAREWSIVQDPSMSARHVIPLERTRRPWIRRRAYWGGVSEVIAHRMRGSSPRHLRPSRALLTFIVLRAAAFLNDPVTDRYIRAHYARGILMAHVRRLAPAA